MLEVPVIYIIISLGSVSCLLLAFLWGVTSPIAGSEHSTALFVLQFCLALVDCTSSVAFLPFMSAFKPQYMTAYFIGEGFSGLIPSLVALVQGAGSMKCTEVAHFRNQSAGNETEQTMNRSQFQNNVFVFNNSSEFYGYSSSNGNKTDSDFSTSIYPVYQEPRFSVKVFFLILMLLLIVSTLSFTFLNFSSYCKREKVESLGSSNRTPSDISDHDPTVTLTADKDVKNILYHEERGPKTSEAYYTLLYKQKGQRCKSHFVTEDSKSVSHLMCPKMDASSEESDSILSKSNRTKMSTTKYSLFLLLTAFLNALSNGVLPSVQSFSCLPYGIEEYHLSVTLASIANPVACLASFLLKMTSLAWTVVSTVIGTALACYIMWTAAASPSPPLVDHWTGSFILVSICVSLYNM